MYAHAYFHASCRTLQDEPLSIREKGALATGTFQCECIMYFSRQWTALITHGDHVTQVVRNKISWKRDMAEDLGRLRDEFKV